MIRFVLLLLAVAAAETRSASGPNPDEIRYARTEAFGKTASILILRPDSLILRKYASRPRDEGDTIGSFSAASDRRRFDSLWAILKKGKQSKGIAPDTKVIVINGRRNGKDVEFIVPVRPPVPEWARTFSNRIGELHALAERSPFSAFSLREKIQAKAGAGPRDSVWLENPGKTGFASLGKCALAVEGARLSDASRLIKWVSLADTAFPQGISLKPQERKPIALALRNVAPGKWYFRAKWGCEPNPEAGEESFREEVFSPLDSAEIGSAPK